VLFYIGIGNFMLDSTAQLSTTLIQYNSSPNSIIYRLGQLDLKILATAISIIEANVKGNNPTDAARDIYGDHFFFKH
jgi:hypothetical protein